MYEVYCDESRPDLMSGANREGFALIGGLWIPSEVRFELKRRLDDLKNQHGRRYQELKWQKVSARDLTLYMGLVDIFLELGESARFRCIAVNASQLDFERFQEGDRELGFYKFYYQMLNPWIRDADTYRVFCDLKSNRVGNRLPALARVINNSHMYPVVQEIQGLPSAESVLLQLVDVLLGAASARLNRHCPPSGPKNELLAHLEAGLRVPQLAPTSYSEQKFNIFMIRLT